MNYRENTSLAFKTPLIVFLLLFLAGCSSLNPQSAGVEQDIASIEDKYEKNHQGWFYHFQLGQKYEQLVQSTGDLTKNRLAIQHYRRALELNPENMGVALPLYELLYQQRVEGNISYEELDKLFQSIPVPTRRTLNPPKLADFLRQSSQHSNEFPDSGIAKKLLFEALAQQPNNGASVFFLAAYLMEEQQHYFAIELLKRTLESAPDAPLLQRQLGFAYEAFANRNYCPYANKSAINKSLRALQNASRNMQNDPNLYYYMALNYQRLNLAPLMLDAARKFNNLEQSVDSQIMLANAYFMSNQSEKGDAIYRQLIEDGNHLAQIDYAFELTRAGNWEQAWEASSEYMKNTRPLSFYGVFLHSFLEAMLDKDMQMSYVDFTQLVPLTNMDDWQRNLAAYWYGELDQQELLESVGDTCQQTEALFYIAAQLYLKQRYTQSLAFLSQVRANKHYSFLEFRSLPFLEARITSKLKEQHSARTCDAVIPDKNQNACLETPLSDVQKQQARDYMGTYFSKLISHYEAPIDDGGSYYGEITYCLDASGQAKDLRLRKDSGHPQMDQAFIDALKKIEPIPMPEDPCVQRELSSKRKVLYFDETDLADG